MPEPVYSIGPIGSRYSLTTFFAGRNIVQCGCWNGTLEDFKTRIDEAYPSCSEGEELIFREQYLAAIKFFETVRIIQNALTSRKRIYSPPLTKSKLSEVIDRR